jgi:hypothetical protein
MIRQKGNFTFKIVAVSQASVFFYRVLHFEVGISAPRLDLGSKSQHILTLARVRSIWDFQPLGGKARAISFDFCDVLDVKTHQKITQRPILAYLSLKGMSACEIHNDIVATLGPDAVSYSLVTRDLCEA